MTLCGPETVELPRLLIKFLTQEEQKELIEKIMERQHEKIEETLKKADAEGIIY